MTDPARAGAEKTPLPPKPPGVRIIAIAAMAKNRAIGSDNALPWNLPEDMKWFRESTRGKTLLMGRKTFAAIGRPLPHRRTIVLTRSSAPLDGVTMIDHLGWLPAAAQGASELWVCGGAEIYALTLPWWDELLLTRVKRSVKGDAFFPKFEDRFRLTDVILETPEMRIERHRPVVP
jgi:dihydrofolate reductase